MSDSDNESDLESKVVEAAVKTGAKVGAKVLANAILPGLGAAVDIYEAVQDAYEGNYVGALFNVAMAGLDLFTLGTASAVKDTAKEVGKNAAIDTAKASTKAASKKFGHEAAKQIAKGGSKTVFSEAARQQSKAAGKQIGRKLAKELSRGMIEDVTENAFKQSLYTATTKGAAMGLIGSGGKDVAKAILEGGSYNLLSEAVAGGTREVSKSAFSSAAKNAVKPVVEEFLESTLKKELLLNASKGTATLLFQN